MEGRSSSRAAPSPSSKAAPGDRRRAREKLIATMTAHADGHLRPRRRQALTTTRRHTMNLPGLNFQLGEDIDALRDAVRAFAAGRDRAARRRDRPQRPVPDGPVAQDGRARRARHHRARGVRRRQHGLPRAHGRDGGDLPRLAPRSACPTARTATCASTRSSATAARRRAQVPAQADLRRARRRAGDERAGRRQRRDLA